MKRKFLFPAMLACAVLVWSCEKEALKSDSTLSDTELALVSEEVASDANFAAQLDEGEDATSWDDISSLTTKSATVVSTCPSITLSLTDTLKTVTFEYSGTECSKSGTVIISYYRPANNADVRKKSITYIDFTVDSVTCNGTKTVESSATGSSISAQLEVVKLNDNNDTVRITRSYLRETEWLCGKDTRGDREDNIRIVTGSDQISKTVNGETVTYSRSIVSPLLLVSACEMKIQAGEVKIVKGDGTEITLTFGTMPENIDCESEFTCSTEFTAGKDGKTFPLEWVNGRHAHHRTHH